MSFRTLTAPSVLRALVLAAAAGFIILFLALAGVRLFYPYELEWVEGALVDHVARVLQGQPLYTAPSVDWVPAIYPPLYYHLSAAMAQLTGIGFLPLRLVSLLSSLGCLALLFAFVKKATGDKAAGLVAAGLFAATFELSGAWLDLARVDALQLLLLLGSLFLLRFGNTRRAVIAAALLTALAIFTKQAALLAALGFAAAAFAQDRRRGLWFSATLALGTLLPFLILNHASGGWFYYYTVAQPAGHALIGEKFLSFWTQDLFRPLAVACVAALGFIIVGAERRVYLLVSAGLLLTAWVPRVKDGNWANDLIPAYALLALLAGLALSAVNEKLKAKNEKGSTATLVFAALLIQFAALVYAPAKLLPTAADRAAGNTLIRSLRAYPGDIWIGHHGYYATLAGKPPHATALAIYDVLRSPTEPAKTLLTNDIERALKARRFRAVITDNDRFVGLADYPEYTRQGGVFPDPDVFWPVGGARTRPLRVYVPSLPQP